MSGDKDGNLPLHLAARLRRHHPPKSGSKNSAGVLMKLGRNKATRYSRQLRRQWVSNLTVDAANGPQCSACKAASRCAPGPSSTRLLLFAHSSRQTQRQLLFENKVGLLPIHVAMEAHTEVK